MCYMISMKHDVDDIWFLGCGWWSGDSGVDGDDDDDGDDDGDGDDNKRQSIYAQPLTR